MPQKTIDAPGNATLPSPRRKSSAGAIADTTTSIDLPAYFARR
jgi:hypothetical protein